MIACTASKLSSTSRKTNALVKSLLNAHFSIGNTGKEQMIGSRHGDLWQRKVTTIRTALPRKGIYMGQVIFFRYLRNRTKRRGAYFIAFAMNLLVLDVINSFS